MDNITPTRRMYVNSHPVSVCLFLLFSSFNLMILWQRNIMVGKLLPEKKRFQRLGTVVFLSAGDLTIEGWAIAIWVLLRKLCQTFFSG